VHSSGETEQGIKVQEAIINTSFTEWATEAEPKIRQSLTAAFGVQVGKDAAADALALAWERWDRVSVMDNPVGYVYGIGRNKARRMKTPRQPMFVEVPEQLLPNVEPGLPAAVADLPEHQRITVTLLHGYGWTMSEVAELLGTKKTTVQNHAERGLTKLRNTLGVSR
jgi:DNA-directed RNA polymerase specialized sigma24 family protein